MKIKTKRGDTAVSEIVGAIFLLAIAISVFSVIYMNVLSDDGPNPETFATIVGKIEAEDVVFEHRSGETLDLDSKVILTVGGERQPPKTLSELLNQLSQQDGVWNIGERIVWPLQNLGIGREEDVRVEGEVFDKESNSLVFWGMLQDGYTVPAFGRGGIWHFDEPIWTGAADEVKDSSGNNNHGTALNGASIIVNDTDVDDDTAHGNCAYFDGIDDHVKVKSVYSLNITQAISVEAWIKPLQERSVLSDIRLEGLKFGYNPDLIKIHNDTYAIAARDFKSQDCVILTFNISADGTVSILDSDIPNNRSVFCDKGDKPDIIHHAFNDSLYIIVYENGTQSKGVICTLEISKNGSIKQSKIDELEFNESECFSHVLTHVFDDIYAITYHSGQKNKPGIGVLSTISVDSDGLMSKIGDFAFNDTGCNSPSITHVSSDIYAIAYRGPNDLGALTTLSIDSAGSISKLNDFIFNDSGCFMPSIISISGDVYAIVYHGPIKQSGKGILTTVNIDSAGSIFKLNDFVFRDGSIDNTCFEPKITHFTNNKYMIIYNDAESNGDGLIQTITIEPDGTIIDTSEPWEPERITDALHEPSDILHIGGRVFTLAFRYKGAGEGSGHPGHIMCLAIGEDPTPTHMRGIVRAGAASIYSQYPRDSTMVNIIASINGPDQLITSQITPDVWHHIALIYDRTSIKLYCDAVLIGEKAYTEEIDIPQNDFLFGHIFYGFLDEIAIYDRALALEEIQIHYNNQ